MAEMLTGWWRVSDIEQLRSLVGALHSRGIRERCLQRQMQKYLEIIPQVCTKHRDGEPCNSSLQPTSPWICSSYSFCAVTQALKCFAFIVISEAASVASHVIELLEYLRMFVGVFVCTSEHVCHPGLTDVSYVLHQVAMIELRELEESQVSVESVRGWCVEEQAMEMDIAVLQQVEELERKVTAASLQVKVKTNAPKL